MNGLNAEELSTDWECWCEPELSSVYGERYSPRDCPFNSDWRWLWRPFGGLAGKCFTGAEQAHAPHDALISMGGLQRIVTRVLSILLPLYSSMQLGGAHTALVLLTAVSASIGALDYRPGKHTLWDSLRRTARTRKVTCSMLLLGLLVDAVCVSSDRHDILLGHLALAASILLFPPPLPTTGWPVFTGIKTEVTTSGNRLSLAKPASPLTASPEETVTTLAAGMLLCVMTVLFSVFSSSTPSVSHHSMIFTTLTVASAAALIFLALPSSLRSQKKGGLALGMLLSCGAGYLQPSGGWTSYIYFPVMCFLSYAAVWWETKATITPQQTYGQGSHTHDEKHVHSHHLHGSRSKLSDFLIKQCTPGSIVHSILIEKDSRRIAYFGM